MLISRAKELAKSWGLALVEGQAYELDLKCRGNYIDTLHQVQIEHLKEDDFIQYYLRDEGNDPDFNDNDIEFNDNSETYVGILNKLDMTSALRH
jgi:hypothetical protein